MIARIAAAQLDNRSIPEWPGGYLHCSDVVQDRPAEAAAQTGAKPPNRSAVALSHHRSEKRVN
jgi:hypothetical protein